MVLAIIVSVLRVNRILLRENIRSSRVERSVGHTEGLVEFSNYKHEILFLMKTVDVVVLAQSGLPSGVKEFAVTDDNCETVSVVATQ